MNSITTLEMEEWIDKTYPSGTIDWKAELFRLACVVEQMKYAVDKKTLAPKLVYDTALPLVFHMIDNYGHDIP
jgi:hypothetical protein